MPIRMPTRAHAVLDRQGLEFGGGGREGEGDLVTTEMCMDMCRDMRTDMCRDMCIDMRTDMCRDMCTDMRVDMCADMCMDMCIDMCMHTVARAKAA